MAQIVRHCPECGWDRPFEQHHDQPGECPDSPDGECAEWSCTACGAAVLVGAIWFSPEPVQPAELHGRAELRGQVA